MSTEQPPGEHKRPPIPTPAKRVPAYNIDKRGDRLYQAQSLHKWFAISSLLLFVFTIVMVLQDYSREWKQYQREFVRLSVQKTQAAANQALNSIDRPKYNELVAQITQANQDQQQSRDKISQLEEQLTSLNARFYGVNLNYQTTKAEYETVRYEYEEADAKKASNADKLRPNVEELEKRMNEYFAEREQITTEIQKTKEELTALQGKKIEADKGIQAMRAEYDRLSRQINTLNPGTLVTSFINAPLLDFLSPSLKINQILLPNLFLDQPFKQIARVDRCTTCHLGIDRKDFEDAPQPFKTHPNMDLYLGSASAHPMDKFGCTTCHGGLDRATNFLTAGHTPRDEKQKEEWHSKYGWSESAGNRHYLENPMFSMGHVEAGCYKCHSASPEVPRAASLDNGRDLIRIYGCFGCHKIPGYDGIRKVGPDLGTVSGKLTKDWMRKWLANPKEFKSEARMPKFWYNSNNSGPEWDKRNAAEINAIVEFLWSQSKPKVLPGGNPSGNAAHGKELVESVGCFGCHAIGPIEEVENRTQTRRKHGFNLASQGSKVSPNWIYNWVKDPRQVWAGSKMPSLRLTDSEAADISAYLSTLKNPDFDAKTPPQVDAAALDTVVLELLRTGSTDAKARQDLAGMSPDQKNLFAGERLIARYGCYGCHNIPKFETAQPIGTELTEAGSKLLSQFDFGFSEVIHIEHSRDAWYAQKLTDPRSFDVGRVKRPEELLKMPNFGFTPKEVESITMVLTSMVKDPVPMDMRDRTVSAITQGRLLIAEKNCRGCHIIEGLGGDIRGFLKAPEQLGFLPPNLNTQGHKTQPEWLHPFLMDPSRVKLRPWLNIRMPTFHFTPAEANVIGAYFSAVDKVQYGFLDFSIETTPEKLRAGAELFEKLACARCHPAGTTLPPGRDPSDLAPNLALARDRLRPDWMVRWFTDPQKIAPNTKMPTNWPADEVNRGKRKSQYPDILGGDAEAQMQAVRDYVYSLGGRVSGSSSN